MGEYVEADAADFELREYGVEDWPEALDGEVRANLEVCSRRLEYAHCRRNTLIERGFAEDSDEVKNYDAMIELLSYEQLGTAAAGLCMN